MTKSELIKVLKDSIRLYGDGPVLHDLDVGDDVIEVTQYSDNPDNSIVLL